MKIFLALLTLTVVAPAFGAPSDRTTYLLSKSEMGGIPNASSQNAAVSHDQRIARLMAYDSAASNLVPGDTNGLKDIFLVRRAEPWGINGTYWRAGATELVSKAFDGTASNGNSYLPALDGDSHHLPHCVAFISEASNLVPGDTNGVADAFVKDLRTGSTIRVSVNSRGQQANGPSLEVAIDGPCERAVFTSSATNLSHGKAIRANWKSAISTKPAPGRQVYVRIFSGAKKSKHNKSLEGLTFLASSSKSGRGANGESFNPHFARSGKAVVFTSLASNLGGQDNNRVSDVYIKTFHREFSSKGRGQGIQALRFNTHLVSGKSGRSANGASSSPQATDDGRYIAYQTSANNLLSGDSNGVSDIVETDLKNPKRPKHMWVSKSKAIGRPGNGASSNPVISGAGEFVLFESEANNLKPSISHKDENGIKDVFLWNRPTQNVSLESRDSDNSFLATPSENPATSSRGNYVPFETSYPLTDLNLASELFPEIPIDSPLAVDLVESNFEGNLHQVYLRYLGPK